MSRLAASMKTGDLRDICAGLLMCVLGLIAAIYVGTHYNLGRIERMGPGMFPLGVSLAIVLFGVLTIASALKSARIENWLKIDVVAIASISAGMAAFALLLPRFGGIPAILALSVLGGLAIRRSFVEIVVLAAALALMAYLIFQVGLGIYFPLLRLP